MQRKSSWIASILFSFVCFLSFGQVPELEKLSWEDYILLVKNGHPAARQAEIAEEQGRAKLLEGRGGFDPKLYGDYSEKNFDSKRYYQIGEGGIKIPTWFGLEFKAAYQTSDGIFLNPQNTLPESGLIYTGVSMPLGADLFLDERRAELMKAKEFVRISEAEKALMLNSLYYEASSMYWDWYAANKTVEVYANALTLAKQRLNAVKQSALYGDKPFIDTVEASIQMQNWEYKLLEAQVTLKNERQRLSTFLWQDGWIPLEADSSVIPPEDVKLPKSIYAYPNDSTLYQHPKLSQYQGLIEQNKIDLRLARQQLKPKLRVNYNPITEANQPIAYSSFAKDNYTWGVNFEMPLFMRKARGKLVQNQLYLENKELELKRVLASVEYEFAASKNLWNTLQGQLKLTQATMTNYQKLWLGELQLFNGGESSLFVVNYRETSFVEAQIKYINLQSKTQKAAIALWYASGQLPKLVQSIAE